MVCARNSLKRVREEQLWGRHIENEIDSFHLHADALATVREIFVGIL